MRNEPESAPFRPKVDLFSRSSFVGNIWNAGRSEDLVVPFFRPPKRRFHNQHRHHHLYLSSFRSFSFSLLATTSSLHRTQLVNRNMFFSLFFFCIFLKIFSGFWKDLQSTCCCMIIVFIFNISGPFLACVRRTTLLPLIFMDNSYLREN